MSNEDIQAQRRKKLLAIVEQAIDEFGLVRVVGAVSDVCAGKAEHVRTTWQDRVLAGRWSRHAGLIESWARKLEMENT